MFLCVIWRRLKIISHPEHTPNHQMFTQPSFLIPKSSKSFAFQSQEYFPPFPDRFEEDNSIGDKNSFTSSFREQNLTKNLADRSNDSRYMKHPIDNWKDNVDVLPKRTRVGDGLGGMDSDNLSYQLIDYGHKKLAASTYDGNKDEPPTKTYRPESQVENLPHSIRIIDQELFQLFEDGLNSMIETDHSIKAILEFDTRLDWILSPIFKDRDLDAVTQRLGQGKESVAAKKLEKMVWLTKKKIQHLYAEIVEDVSAKQKALVSIFNFLCRSLWLIDFNGMSTCLVILCLEVRELHTLYIYICLVVS